MYITYMYISFEDVPAGTYSDSGGSRGHADGCQPAALQAWTQTTPHGCLA